MTWTLPVPVRTRALPFTSIRPSPATARGRRKRICYRPGRGSTAETWPGIGQTGGKAAAAAAGRPAANSASRFAATGASEPRSLASAATGRASAKWQATACPWVPAPAPAAPPRGRAPRRAGSGCGSGSRGGWPSGLGTSPPSGGDAAAPGEGGPDAGWRPGEPAYKGGAAWRNSARVWAPVSTMRPRYITATRSAMCFTTARSCAMNR